MISQSCQRILRPPFRLLRRGIHKSGRNNGADRERFRQCSLPPVNPFATTGQYDAIGTVRNAIMKSFEDATSDGSSGKPELASRLMRPSARALLRESPSVICVARDYRSSGDTEALNTAPIPPC